ncbi:protein kinase [uncultured Paludibaculum sp.]|uniref:serine/threonine-protein kinase n=1 Tax=uncultured Paludibaculum sp. TaxID=1765020 RepID=UPI002AAA8526|nr:protein kinase [uncultured Paludibaculum sp.]
MASPVSIESLLIDSRGRHPHVPGYQLLALLGRGGMGVVYAAAQEGSDSLIAIKLLRGDIATPANLARFGRERRILEQLSHPDVAKLLGAGETPDGTPYLVMEYVEGRSILDYCKARGLDDWQRVRLFHDVCLVVAAAHDRAIVHSDLKPGNILVNAGGRPKLLDFGIAKMMAPGEEGLTVTGFRPLTPQYASIEQLRGGPITLASDVYSLGAILSELAGPGDSGLSAIIRHAMAEQPDARYQTARELAQDVAAYLEGRPLTIAMPPPRLQWKAAAVAVTLALLPALWQHLPGSEPMPSPSERDYLVARHLWNKLSMPELHKAEAWFRLSVQKDPQSSMAHAGLADALYFAGELEGGNPHETFRQAKVEARRAIELNDRSPLAHTVLGSVLFASDLKWAYAEAEFQQALKLDPRCVRAMQGYACMLMRLGRLGEAGFLMKRARLLDPASPILGFVEARVPYYAHRFDVARDLLRGVLDRDPSFSLAHYYLALCYRFLGQTHEAESEMKRANLSNQGLAIELAWIHGRDTTPEQWQQLLATERHNPSMLFAAAEMGRTDLAFELLEEAIAQRQTLVLGMKVDPRFDALRGDPRFPALLRQAGLANLS